MDTANQTKVETPAKKSLDIKPQDSGSQPIGIKAEIVKDVPIKLQAVDNSSPVESTQAAYNPISGNGHTVPGGTYNEDAELDNILKDVNHEVRTDPDSTKKNDHVSIFSRSGSQSQKTKAGTGVKQSGSKLVIAIAIIVVALLIAVAIYAFRQSQASSNLAKAHSAAVEQAKKQEAAKPLPATFDADYLNSFNDSLTNDNAQNFDADSLSDSALGL